MVHMRSKCNTANSIKVDINNSQMANVQYALHELKKMMVTRLPIGYGMLPGLQELYFQMTYVHAQKLIRLMQRCSLNNAWTMLLSRFNNTCWIDNVDEYCSINSCSMLTKNNNCYNVVGARADNSWWNKLADGCQNNVVQCC